VPQVLGDRSRPDLIRHLLTKPAACGLFCARNIAPLPRGPWSLPNVPRAVGRGRWTVDRGHISAAFSVRLPDGFCCGPIDQAPVPDRPGTRAPAPGSAPRGPRCFCHDTAPRPAPRGPRLGTRGARPPIASPAPWIAGRGPRATPRRPRRHSGIKVHVSYKQYCEKKIRCSTWNIFRRKNR